MDNPQNIITSDFIRNQYPKCNNIVNLFKGDIAADHFTVDTVDMFKPSGHLPINTMMFQVTLHKLYNFIDKVATFKLFMSNFILKFTIDSRLQIAQRIILKLLFNPGDPETIGKGRIDIQSLLGNRLLALGLLKVEGPHIVDAVNQFYHQNPYILDHRKDHFAIILGLMLAGALKFYFADFSQALDESGNLITKTET